MRKEILNKMKKDNYKHLLMISNYYGNKFEEINNKMKNYNKVLDKIYEYEKSKLSLKENSNYNKNNNSNNNNKNSKNKKNNKNNENNVLINNKNKKLIGNKRNLDNNNYNNNNNETLNKKYFDEKHLISGIEIKGNKIIYNINNKNKEHFFIFFHPKYDINIKNNNNTKDKYIYKVKIPQQNSFLLLPYVIKKKLFKIKGNFLMMIMIIIIIIIIMVLFY